MSAAAAAAAAGLMPSGKAGENAKALSMILIVIAVLVLGYVIVKKVFGGFDAFFEAMGLKESAEDKARREALLAQLQATNNPQSPWSVQFYKSAPSGTRLITKASAEMLAKKIWDSVGAVWDDPEAGLGAIKDCPTQAAVSFLVDVFQQKYSRDLLNWLSIKYDTDTQKDILLRIIDYVNKLPKYV